VAQITLRRMDLEVEREVSRMTGSGVYFPVSTCSQNSFSSFCHCEPNFSVKKTTQALGHSP